MKIAVFNQKGGVGKSTIAYSIALENDFALITNEKRSPVLDIFPKGKALILDDNSTIVDLDDEIDVVFDFRGNTEGNLAREVLKIAEQVIIPVTYQDENDYFPANETFHTIKDVSQLTDKITIVANQCSSANFDAVKRIFEKDFPYPVKHLIKSNGLSKAYIRGIGITEFASKEAMPGNYQKVIQQLAALLDF